MLELPAAVRFDFALELRLPVAKFGNGLVVGCMGDFVANQFIRGNSFALRRECFGNDRLRRIAIRKDGVLRQVGDLQFLVLDDFAIVGVFYSRQYFEQGRFPRAIMPDETDLFALLDDE